MNAAESEKAFTISFTSIVIILLSFFIYMNTLATPNTVKKKSVIQSLEKQFGRRDTAPVPEDAFKQTPMDMPISELTDGFPALGFATRYSALADLAEEGFLPIEREDDRFIISFAGERLFESGDDQISARSISILQQIANQAKAYNLKVEIEGHTDDKPVFSDRFASNWELSAARAVSVLRLFLDFGISSENLVASGHGEFKPVAENTTEEGRAKNRRVNLVIKEQPPVQKP